MKNERIDIPAELFEDEVVCFIADRYHTSAENVVRCFLVQDGIYPEQKNEPFCQAEGNRACSNCQGEKWKNEIQPIDFRLEDNEIEIMRDMIAKSQINE